LPTVPSVSVTDQRAAIFEFAADVLPLLR